MAGEIRGNFNDIIDTSKRFGQMAAFFRAVDKAMEVAVQILEVTAFIGLIGQEVAKRYLNEARPKVTRVAEKCEEIGKDLADAVNVSYQPADMQVQDLFK